MNGRQQQGFSLVEALITLALLGVGLAGAAKLQSLVFSRMLDARAQNEAMQFTLEQIEYFQFQTRYAETLPRLPLRKTLTGSHSHYRLEGMETETEPDAVRQLHFTTRWETPGTDGELAVHSFFTDASYTRHLHRLER